MALVLTTSWQTLNHGSFNADGNGFYVSTQQYAYYEMISSSVARVHIKQVVWADSGTWYGTNNYYRSRDVNDAYFDSGYNQYSSSFGGSEVTLWEGTYDISSDAQVGAICYFGTYGGTYYADNTTYIQVPASAFATAPTGLAISNISATHNTVTATVSVTGWGGAGDATTRYRNLSVCQEAANHNVRRYQRVYGDTMSSAITVDNNTQYGTMTIQPNTQYWLWWYATNGTVGSEAPTPSTTSVITKAAPTIVQITGVTTNSATFAYTIPADGGYYDKTFQYSIDSGTTWTTVATITGGSASSGTFTVSGLTAATGYTLQTRTTTTAGTTSGENVIFSTMVANIPRIRMYGSANSEAQRITELYGGTTMTQYAVIGIANNPTLNLSAFNTTYSTHYGRMTERPQYLTVTSTGGTTSVSLNDGTTKSLFSYSGQYTNQGVAWGFQQAPVSGLISSQISYSYASRRLTKLYGSVNGETKLIYQGFRHINYSN